MGQIVVTLKPWKSHTMGIELECYPEEASFAYKNMDEYSGFWFITEDGSLSFARRGRELISQPLPYEKLLAQLEKLPSIAGNWDVDHTCGIHIHVSRKFMSMKRVAEYLDAIASFSREQNKTLFGREPNQYCSPVALQKKYRSINCLHEHTYEFRMFSSGDKEWAKECVRRTYLMARYKGPITVQALKTLFGIADKKEEPTPTAVKRVRRTSRETVSW